MEDAKSDLVEHMTGLAEALLEAAQDLNDFAQEIEVSPLTDDRRDMIAIGVRDIISKAFGLSTAELVRLHAPRSEPA
jgi:hypothetical protein